MASIRKRGSSWHVQIRRDGFSSLSKSFSIKADALEWAREQERAIDRAELPSAIHHLKGMTVADLLKRYEAEVTPKKRGARSEKSRIRKLLNHDVAKSNLYRLSGATIAAYRNDRLKVVKSASVRRELVILRHVFEVARQEWGIAIRCNPVAQIKLPEDSKPRERRLEDGDAEQLLRCINAKSAWYLRPFIDLAIETGMRRGELLSIQWQDVSLTTRTIHIPKTKNGHPRTIPLTSRAVEILSSLERKDDRVFPVTANAVRSAWDRLRRRAGLEDLRLHDLRHEAVSRFFEYGLTVPEVALISGHRDPRMLFRYTHLKPEQLALKLARQANR